MLERLSFGASIAITTLLLFTKTPANAVLTRHTGIPVYSVHAAMAGNLHAKRHGMHQRKGEPVSHHTASNAAKSSGKRIAVNPRDNRPAKQQKVAVTVQGDFCSLRDRIASAACAQATQMDTVGFCYRGVKRALNKVGIALEGTAAYMAANQLMSDARFFMVPLKNLQKGDILVHDRSAAHPYGHIAVYLGDGREASDHVQKLVLGGRYGKTVVFRAHDIKVNAKLPIATIPRSNDLAMDVHDVPAVAGNS